MKRSFSAPMLYQKEPGERYHPIPNNLLTAFLLCFLQKDAIIQQQKDLLAHERELFRKIDENNEKLCISQEGTIESQDRLIALQAEMLAKSEHQLAITQQLVENLEAARHDAHHMMDAQEQLIKFLDEQLEKGKEN